MLDHMVVAFALALVVASLAAPAPRAAAYERPAELERVASILASRQAEVRCPSMEGWIGDPIWGSESRAWAYTSMTKDYIVLHPALCAGARAMSSTDVPLWQRAAGVLVLVHEAYHVRRWAGRWNEAKVECRAIRDFTKAVVLLGGSRELANELLPSALAAHLRMGAVFPEYRARECKLPVWTPPFSP
jgi:hypothetical protein